FQADGQAVMTATLDGMVRTWDLVGSPGTVPKGLTWKAGGSIRAMAFHPDGHALLTAGDGEATRFWNSRTGDPLRPTLAHARSVASAATSPDGKPALTACSRMHQRGDDFEPRGEVFRWDTASGAVLGRLIEIPELVDFATFVHGSQAVLLVSSEYITAGRKLRLFDAVSGKLIAGPLKPGGERADHVALSPDGR